MFDIVYLFLSSIVPNKFASNGLDQRDVLQLRLVLVEPLVFRRRVTTEMYLLMRERTDPHNERARVP
jgi:hypothetical protein